jgi:hypothetical protein
MMGMSLTVSNQRQKSKRPAVVAARRLLVMGRHHSGCRLPKANQAVAASLTEAAASV